MLINITFYTKDLFLYYVTFPKYYNVQILYIIFLIKNIKKCILLPYNSCIKYKTLSKKLNSNLPGTY